ncbi:MAG: hypothetical protein KAS72_04295 [Phycisphaerales bacterium]|nr:hypothetical protein [Phycisphaerales bacterium]
MSKTRSAHHTIAGYHYQFDKSILEILRARPTARIALENIEDVDVEGECIQCKYHAAQRYQPSAIRKPLLAFLKHYRDDGGQHRYTLYAHFRDPGNFKPIGFPELKAILGKERTALKLSDRKLRLFLKDHFRYEDADDIDTQQQAVLAELGSVMSAPRADCEQYYYGNALHEVFRLARQADVKSRTTTRRGFVAAIDKKRVIFRRWLAEMRGQKNYVKHVRESLKAADALRSNKRRFVYLTDDFASNLRTVDIATFCRKLADQYFELGKVLYDAEPVTVIIERPLEQIKDVQQRLLAAGIRLNTGYEGIAFQPALFNERPIINKKADHGGKATDKVSNASYRIAVIGADTYKAHATQIDSPDTFIIAGDSHATNLAAPKDAQVFRITDTDSLGSLARILAQ